MIISLDLIGQSSDSLRLFVLITKTKNYQSNSFSFRSRPVVRVTGKVELETTNGQIDPENRTCSLKSGSLVSCMTVKGCLKYEGDAVASELGNCIIKLRSS